MAHSLEVKFLIVGTLYACIISIRFNLVGPFMLHSRLQMQVSLTIMIKIDRAITSI